MRAKEKKPTFLCARPRILFSSQAEADDVRSDSEWQPRENIGSICLSPSGQLADTCRGERESSPLRSHPPPWNPLRLQCQQGLWQAATPTTRTGSLQTLVELNARLMELVPLQSIVSTVFRSPWDQRMCVCACVCAKRRQRWYRSLDWNCHGSSFYTHLASSFRGGCFVAVRIRWD